MHDKTTHQCHNVKEKIQHIISFYEDKGQVDQEEVANHKEAERRKKELPTIDLNLFLVYFES